ncbi:unnamed protein product [Clavelina lepadiformis]|uniref:Tyrosinase copper-binding domain-containing protein n=1 Tax=Clavelina lepadiformis TaxID=159417 RepID=A0ABP0GBU0_CLALP
MSKFSVSLFVNVLLVVLSFIPASRAQFPRACATLQAYLSHECCPLVNGSACAKDTGRGSCSDISIDDAPHGQQYVLVGIDDRERWPERFFNRSCVCNRNFGGFDCSGCKYGWQGNDCSQRRPVVVRKNVLNMDEDEREKFLEVLDLSKTTPHPDYVIAQDHYRNLLSENGTRLNYVNISIYDLFVWVHYYSVRDTLLGPGQAYTAIDFSHEGPAFLTWHRMHLLALEGDLQQLSGDPDFALPYWNFATGGTECDICNNTLLGARDAIDQTLLDVGSRFADWQVICLSLDWFNDNVKLCNGTEEGPIRRNPGGNVDRPTVQVLPQPGDVAQCLQVDQYDTFPFFSTSDGFRNALEGYSHPGGEFENGVRTLHNLAHLFLNGTGGLTHASANDPLFVLLHTFTDAIFDEWMNRSNANISEYPQEDAPIGHNRNFNMVPFFPPVQNKEMFVPAEQLGYSYAVEFPDSADSSDLNDVSFIWSIIGVGLFVVGTIIVVALVQSFRYHMRKRREEKLYESLIGGEPCHSMKYKATDSV